MLCSEAKAWRLSNMKEWFCSSIRADDESMRGVLDELNDIEADTRAKYTVQQIVYVNGCYKIFYTKE